MNCQKFQEVLPYIIESGGNPQEEEHLRSCAACAELVQDLQYIAQQAKLLLPMHDPSPRVWTGIEQNLRRQGLDQEGRMSPWGQTTTLTHIKSWTTLGWFMAFAAVVLFAIVLANYHPQLPSSLPSEQNVSTQAAAAGDDQQLLNRVSGQPADVRRAYENSLREVNAYIVDAQQAVDRDPQDAAARAYLLDAYQQKEMLYQMATARALP
ncbi:MAG TPA: hypothetical protein VKW06_21670 [Candidatus Angelobacter sp.]|nr:hypothetical protein [Candidatus Angelobacter sp.]